MAIEKMAGGTATPSRRTLAARALASFFVVVVAFAATIAAGLTAQRRAVEDVSTFSEGYVPLETALARARATQWTLAALLDRLVDDARAAGTTREWIETVVRGRTAVLNEARAAAAERLGTSKDADTRAFGNDMVSQLESVERDLADGARTFPDLFGAIEAASRGGDKHAAEQKATAIAARERAAAERLEGLAQRIVAQRKKVVAGSLLRDRRATAISIVLAMSSLVVAAIVTMQLRRRLAPLARLTERAQAIAAGDRSPIPIELLEGRRGLGGAASRDEIADLAVAFAAMVDGVASRDAELSRLQRRQEDIVDHLRAAVVALRIDGSVEAANPVARALLGADVGGSLATSAPTLWALVAGDVARALDDGVEPMARSGVSLPAATTASDGASPQPLLVVDVRVVAMRAEGSNDVDPRLALLVVDDVSEAAMARTRALQAERLAAIGKMAAHVTHEIRNPLSSIGLNVELLEETIGKAHDTEDVAGASLTEARTLLAAIAREVQRLSGVSEDYLRLARSPSPRATPVDVVELVRDVLAFARPELDRARVQLDIRLPGAPLVTSVDAGQLRQSLLNLLRNAREAMEDGGVLTVEVRRRDDQAEIAVTDDGPGISADLRLRIFDPFFTTKATGTGLGLPLTRQIIEAHGGTIACETASPRGTRFVIALPVHAMVAEA